MREMKLWLSAGLVVVALSVTALLTESSVSRAAPERVALKDHWRHHDGHWSYWHEGDQRWYYTDGSNWYYNTGDAWRTYAFDQKFGREGFERGEYKVPGEGVKIVVPGHMIFRR